MKIQSKINNWLDKPYSFKENISFKLFVSFGTGMLIFIILFVVQPFGLYQVSNDKFTYFLGYGLIIISIILIYFFIVNPIFPNYFSAKNWTIKREIVTLTLIVLIISYCLWKYHTSVAIGIVNKEKYTYLFFLKSSILLAIFPIMILMYASEKFLEQDYKYAIEELDLKNVNKLFEKKPIKIVDTYGNNFVEFHIENLIYINSEGNNAIFYIKKTNEIIENKIRVPLKKIENYFKDHKQIIKCHKSYLINTNHIKEVIGNSKRSYVVINNTTTKIPISRSFNKEKLKKYML